MSLKLAAGGRTTLVFYQDGHREELTGPCLVRLTPTGCQVLLGGSGCLVRVDGKQRQLVLPQHGNLESVGGAIAATGDPGVQKEVLRSKSDDEPLDQAPPVDDGLQFSYRQIGETAQFQVDGGSTVDATFVLAGPGAYSSVRSSGGVLGLPNHLVKPGQSYRLIVYRKGKVEQRVPFRLLSPAELAELEGLLKTPLSDSTRAALAISRLESLGFPSLAAQVGEKLSQKLNGRDLGLLTYLYRLYSGELNDPKRAKRLERWAKG